MNLTLRQIKKRVVFFALFWFVLLGLFIFRCYHVQIKRHDELLKKAQERYTTSAKRGGKRGEIFDRDGKLLVSNVPRITIACSPYSCVHEPYVRLENSRRRGVKESLPARREKRRQVLSAFLAKEFGKTRSEFYEKLTPFVPVRNSHGGFVRNEDGSLKMKKNHYLLLEREATPEFAAAFREKLKKNQFGLCFSRICF
jgi:cell division protein FtsI/penicillin-binding protein 2